MKLNCGGTKQGATSVERPESKNFRWDLAFTEPAKTKPVARTARTLAKKRAEEEAGPAEP